MKEMQDLSVAPQESQWEEVQMKTFCGWINMHLQERQIRVHNLETDLSDGVKLIALLEELNGEKIEGRYYRNPKSKPYKLDNVSFALNFITDVLGVKLISCSPEDIVEGNLKIILGMLWRLIHKFQLKNENSQKWLLVWTGDMVSPFNLRVENFHSSFENGLVFCALLRRIDPTFLDFDSLTPEERVHNLRLAFNVAEEVLEIPQLLDPEDISKGLADERSVITYLSMIHRAYERRSREAHQSAPPPVVQNQDKLNEESEKLASQNESLRKEIEKNSDEMSALKRRLAELQEESQALQESHPTPLELAKNEIISDLHSNPAFDDSEEESQFCSDTEPEHESDRQKHADSRTSNRSEEEPSESDAEPPSSSDTHYSSSALNRGTSIDPDPVIPPHEASADLEPLSRDVNGGASLEVARANSADPKHSNSELNQQIEDCHQKFRQQIRISETLQKSLEDIREEILMTQKKQKRAYDRALKRIQRKYDRRLQRRDNEIQTLQKEHTYEMQQKCNEITTLRRQLKKIQEALGGGAVGPSKDEPVFIDLDIQALKVEKDELLAMAKLFEEEEISMIAKRTDDYEEYLQD